MKTFRLFSLLSVALVALFCISSCKKDDDKSGGGGASGYYLQIEDVIFRPVGYFSGYETVDTYGYIDAYKEPYSHFEYKGENQDPVSGGSTYQSCVLDFKCSPTDFKQGTSLTDGLSVSSTLGNGLTRDIDATYTSGTVVVEKAKSEYIEIRFTNAVFTDKNGKTFKFNGLIKNEKN